ncbi:MAG TPA: ferrous iron transport protein B [Candidatus Cloacimonadota bacterium]|mgnify:CR=1 FL=1|nr:ferrous iron transport protein B [Candidatus Cloacimonadota bacterium]HOH59524.1 ferrous iron transport protein B [Candidatus Cloacimonadota bacterium]HPI25144.1 ferrous iron transport protein B [Candidatus Cloacimonadota bacterium]
MTLNKKQVIALAGNPNVGKTTLFNALTGSRQTVGNWPGVTVEHKSGSFTYKGTKYEVIDLPGIYSLSGGTPDELVARNYILNEKPDLIINIVDASNLERNLYLTVQLMELGAPILMCLSMVDIAERNGLKIDVSHLSSHLGFEVTPVVLNKRYDPEALMQRIDLNLSSSPIPAQIRYDEVVEEHLDNIWKGVLSKSKLDSFDKKKPLATDIYWQVQKTRWQALKVIEGDPEYLMQLSNDELEAVQREIRAIEKHRGQVAINVIADDRYGFIRGLVKDVVRRRRPGNWTFSDTVDRVLLSGFLGLPIFFIVMYLVFLIAVKASEPVIGIIEVGLGWLFLEQLPNLLAQLNVPAWISYFLSEAIGGGIVTIGSFIPPIFFIYISLSILEDSGYMARAAFIADKFMRRIGLPGKAFIPLLVGFGCTVPAIMATRTLESPRDRVFASLLTPFMSCGAKLPVYTFLAMIFFPQRASIVIFGLYFFGVIMAMLTGLLLKKTIFKSEPGNFVMELPSYHVPTFNGIMLHTWFRLKDFILRAGKTILTVIVAITILQAITVPNIFSPQREKVSVLEVAGHAITPALEPIGINADNWAASVALITGLFAKEAIVGTMQSLYSGTDLSMEMVEEDKAPNSLSDNLKTRFGSWAAALAYLLFVVLYSPCAAALAMLFKEHGSKWTIFSFLYLNLLAWIIAMLFFQIAHFNSGSLYWIVLGLGILALIYFNLRNIGKRHERTA